MPSIINSVETMTEKPKNVFIAVPGDEEEIFRLLDGLHEENGIFLKSDDRVKETIFRATNKQGGVIGIIRDQGKIIASVGLFLDQYWYTDDYFVSEYWNYVHPDYRTKKAIVEDKVRFAQDLIDFSKWFNENMGLVLSMGIMSTTRMEAKVRLYERKFQKVGAFFMHGLPEGKAYLGHGEQNG